MMPEQFEVRASDDEVKRDLELTCTECDAAVCDIQVGDTLRTIMWVVHMHKCVIATTHTCQHCDRSIALIDGRWVDPLATGDDRMWHETCDGHDTIIAEHEPDVSGNPVATCQRCGQWVERVSYPDYLWLADHGNDDGMCPGSGEDV